MLLASGVLSFIASGLFMLSGIAILFVFFLSYQPQFQQQISPQVGDLAILGGLSLFSFGLSLTGGVLTLDRERLMWVYRLFVIAMVGPVIPFGISIATPPTNFFGGNLLVSYFISFSLPAICLDAVSLIFVRLRRDDFTKN
jgi:hypothetical protein